MADAREVLHRGAQNAVQVLSIADASGWYVIEQVETDDGPHWRREPLATWALVQDGPSTFVTGLCASGLDVVELAPHPARYVHASELPPCTCRTPRRLGADAFCATCAGTTSTLADQRLVA